MSSLDTIIQRLQDALNEAVAVKNQPVVFPVPKIFSSGPVNLSRVVALQNQYPGWERYERMQHHVSITKDTFSFTFYLTNIAVGGSGANMAFAYPKYGLRFANLIQAMTGDLGTERATYKTVGTERMGTFNGTLGDEADGAYLVSIVAYDANGNLVANPVESLMPFWLWVDRKGNAKNFGFVINQNGVFDWTHPIFDSAAGNPPYFRWCAIPKDAYNTHPTYPLDPVTPTVFSDPVGIGLLKMVQYVPGNGGNEMNIHKPAMTKAGITVTENLQSYFVEDWIKHYPRLAELDGERGIATAHFTTWLRIGRNAKVYCGNPWSCFVIDATGKRKTLFGLRHKVSPYWEDTTDLALDANGNLTDPNIEIVGDWGDIPKNECFAWESWGGKFRAKSVMLNMNVPAIGGEQPHVLPGPQLFTCDRHGYVLKAQFSATDHTVPAKMTRLCQANDPWGLDIDDDADILYISERKRHALVAINMDTGEKTDILVNPNGDSFGTVKDSYRRWYWAGVSTTAGAQAAIAARRKDCQVLAPEGIAVQDGWLYYAAYALQEVRRINLTTKEIQVCCRPSLGDIIGNQPHYIFIAISDGTFGPRGTIFTTTFGADFPNAWLPVAGTDTDGTPLTHSQRWNWITTGYEVYGGDTGRQDGYQYAMAVIAEKGMLAKGSSNRGLDVHVLADVPDTVDDFTEYAKAKNGGLYWRLHGYDLIWDQLGYAAHSIPLPWGENADLDFWLKLSGHKNG